MAEMPAVGVTEHAPLVAAARAGDRFAFGQLYQLYAPMVHAVLLSHASPPEVDDLLQDVFVRAMAKLKRLRDVDAFGGWLAAIARNLARDHFRRHREQDELADVPVHEHQSGDTEAAGALEAICRLPESYRETLMMRLVEGLTGPEIAARTGLTHGTVRVNLHRGMKLLREQLEKAV